MDAVTRQAIAVFLRSKEGQELIVFLKAKVPKYQADTIEQGALSGAQRAGAEIIVVALEKMKFDAPTQDTSPNAI